MNINKDYIKGVLDATLELYEIENGRIERDKELEFTLVEKPNYLEVWFTCKITLSSKWNVDHSFYQNKINIYEADKLSSFISDVNMELSEIHLKTINYL